LCVKCDYVFVEVSAFLAGRNVVFGESLHFSGSLKFVICV
jgi:hypothetical protein